MFWHIQKIPIFRHPGVTLCVRGTTAGTHDKVGIFHIVAVGPGTSRDDEWRGYQMYESQLLPVQAIARCTSFQAVTLLTLSAQVQPRKLLSIAPARSAPR